MSWDQGGVWQGTVGNSTAEASLTAARAAPAWGSTPTSAPSFFKGLEVVGRFEQDSVHACVGGVGRVVGHGLLPREW